MRTVPQPTTSGSCSPGWAGASPGAGPIREGPWHEPCLPVPRKANGVLEARQLAMRIFEDYTVSWYWIVM